MAELAVEEEEGRFNEFGDVILGDAGSSGPAEEIEFTGSEDVNEFGDAIVPAAEAEIPDGSPHAEKPGIHDAITDSNLETIAFMVGLPMSVVDAFIQVGFDVRGMERDPDIVGKTPGSIGWVLDGLKGKGFEIDEEAIIGGRLDTPQLHTDTAFEDRSPEGQIAKVGMDVASMAIPGLGAERLAAQGTQAVRNLARGQGRGTAAIPQTQQALLKETQQVQSLQKARTAAASQPAVFSMSKTPFKPGNITADKVKVAIAEQLERANTKAGLAGELTAVAGAGQGEMIAQTLDPGDASTRMVAGVLGAFANPTGTIYNGVKFGSTGLHRAWKSFFEAGQEDMAAGIVTDFLNATGEIASPEDMAALIAKLKAAEPGGKEFVSGAKTDSTALLRLDRFVAGKSGDAADQQRNLMAQGYKALDDMIESLYADGSPVAMKAAAELQHGRDVRLIDGALDLADSRAKAKAGEVRTGATIEDTGEATQGIIDEAVKHLDDVEGHYWSRVGKGEADVPEIKRIYDNLRASRLVKEGTFEGEDTIKRWLKDGHAGSGEVQILRSKMMSNSRALRAAQNDHEAAILEEMANGLADSMKHLPGWEQAREFTRLYNDKFSRTFAGKLEQKGRQGAAKIAPEESTEKMIGSGGVRGNRQAQETTDAAQFAVDNPNPGVTPSAKFNPQAPEQLAQQQSDFLRLSASRLLKEDGTVNPDQLARWREKNKSMLSRPEFKQVSEDLANAETAARAFKTAQKTHKGDTAALKTSALGRLVGDEDPVRAIGRLLDGRTPTKDIDEISRLASSVAEKEGLAGGMIRHAVGNTDNMTFKKMQESLTAPKYGEKSVLDMVDSNKLMNPDSVKQMRMLLKRAVEVENAADRGASMTIDQIEQNASSVFDLMTRIVGAKLGASGAAGTTGSTIVAAGAGSRFLRNALIKTPWNKFEKILVEAANNPQFMAKLLEKSLQKQTKEQAVNHWKVINQGLVAAGAAETTGDDSGVPQTDFQR